jgi:hypothetical protein
MILIGTKKVTVQGLNCYLPKLKVYTASGKALYVLIGEESPLVNKKDALKYASIWKNQLETA